MNDFKKFLEIPNEEISKNTHILVEFIVYIKDKDYDKIKIKAHFNGFIHSISNEYDFDLQFLIDEYEEFYHPKAKIIDEPQEINKKDDSPKVFMNDEDIKENKLDSNNYLIIIASIFTIVLVMFWMIFKDDGTSEKKVLFIEKEKRKENNTKEVIKQEKKVIFKKVKKKEVKKNVFDLSKAKKMYKVKNGVLLLEPFKDNKLWLGLINLNNKKQIGGIVSGLASYKLKSNTIILTGHGYLNFINRNNNKSTKYRTFDKLFFYYKNGFLYKITKEDVLALNGGFVW